MYAGEGSHFCSSIALYQFCQKNGGGELHSRWNGELDALQVGVLSLLAILLEQGFISLGEGYPLIQNKLDYRTGLEMLISECHWNGWLCNLQKCNKVYAKHVHMHISSNGVDAYRAALSDHLVPVFSGSNSMNNDDQDSYKLLPSNNYSWDSAIHQLTVRGQPKQALNLFEEMQAAHGHLNRHTLQALLRACGRLKCLERGRKLHGVATKAAFDSDHFVGSTLVDMYGKCGHLAEAQEVFDKLQIRDVVLWTSLIAAYAEHGYGAKALNCLKQMQLEGVLPNPVTFVCSLKACGSMGAIDKGRGIHSEIVRQGYEGVLIVGSALVDMYAKCVFLTEAREVLDQLPGADAVSWTALMVRYAEHGFGGETLNCLESMQKKGMPLDAVTLICSLKACGATGAIGRGREIHAEIAREGWESNLSVCNTLVDMYAKCGSLEEAEEVFDELSVRDVVSWNALISGYAEHGLGLEALHCLKQMQQMGASPGAVTFVCSLKAIGSIDRGQEIHMEISKDGFERNIFVGSALVDMYAKFGLFAEALKLFDELSVQNAVSWTALIAGYADQGLGEEALHLLDKMVSEGVPVDILTIVCSLKACGRMKAIARGREIHAKIAIEGFERDPSIGSMLVDMYARCGSLSDAEEVFDRLPTQRMASWNSLIAGYAEHGFGEEAVECLGMMQLEGVSMDAVTFSCSLKACGSIGALDKGRELHAKIAKEGLERDTVIGNTLVDLYAKCGSVAEAQEVFDKLPICNTVSWTALITGYACQGESEHVFHLFEIMRKAGIQPDKVTFLSLLTVCSHVGLVEKGQEYFDAMCAGYGISPDADHLNCIVDLFGRAGQLNNVSLILDKMPFQPNISTWHSVLGACRKWGDVELGKAAFEGALKLDENQVAAFILMFNILADAHMWEDMKMVESMRTTISTWKELRNTCGFVS